MSDSLRLIERDDAERGRALVDRMFELPRPSPEWEQALAELRVWSMERPSADSSGAIDALYSAHDFIARVHGWQGSDPDERDELLTEIAKHLPQGGQS